MSDFGRVMFRSVAFLLTVDHVPTKWERVKGIVMPLIRHLKRLVACDVSQIVD